MNLLISGIDTIECAYYLNSGGIHNIDFNALRAQKEAIRQSKHPESGVLELGGMEFMLSPNGTKSGYPFLISNQDCTIQFAEFNSPSFFVKYSSFALWNKGAKFLHQRFLDWAGSLGFVAVRAEGLSRCDFAFDFHLEDIDFDEVRIPVNVTTDSGNVTGNSGERDRWVGVARFNFMPSCFFG